MQITHLSRAFSLGPASAGLVIVLVGSAAQAQIIPLTSPPSGYTATTTANYSTGDANGYIYGPFTVAAGSINVTYTATTTSAAAGSVSFESFTNDGALDFPLNTVAVDTFSAETHDPTGPLLISFSSGISAFGIQAESSRSDTSTFTFTAYSGGTILGSYTLAPVTQVTGSLHSVFIGAQAIGGNSVTSVQISDVSLKGTYTGGSNDFYVGPLSIYAPVPEASTTVSFGLLLALGLGGALVASKKRVGSA